MQSRPLHCWSGMNLISGSLKSNDLDDSVATRPSRGAGEGCFDGSAGYDPTCWASDSETFKVECVVLAASDQSTPPGQMG